MLGFPLLLGAGRDEVDAAKIPGHQKLIVRKPGHQGASLRQRIRRGGTPAKGSVGHQGIPGPERQCLHKLALVAVGEALRLGHGLELPCKIVVHGVGMAGRGERGQQVGAGQAEIEIHRARPGEQPGEMVVGEQQPAIDQAQALPYTIAGDEAAIQDRDGCLAAGHEAAIDPHADRCVARVLDDVLAAGHALGPFEVPSVGCGDAREGAIAAGGEDGAVDAETWPFVEPDAAVGDALHAGGQGGVQMAMEHVVFDRCNRVATGAEVQAGGLQHGGAVALQRDADAGFARRRRPAQHAGDAAAKGRDRLQQLTACE